MFFVTNSRGKSETSRGESESLGSPTKLAEQCFGGESGDNRAVYAAKRHQSARFGERDFVPFHRGFIEGISKFYRNF